jgi:SAM-dependent methyltransferase
MTNFQMLVVSPVGWDEEPVSQWSPYSLQFQFVTSFPPDGLSAWRASTSTEREIIDVAASCYPYSGGYAQHALNRFYSQAILRLSPKLVVIAGLIGCTVDLVRVADLLSIPVVLILDGPAEPLGAVSEATQIWLQSSLAACKYIVAGDSQSDPAWPDSWIGKNLISRRELAGLVDNLLAQPLSHAKYDYSLYEFCQRDHPLLVKMQQRDTIHFRGCTSVLDLACGVGIFLDCLRQEGINSEGVERDFRVANYARGMGLNVTVSDALEFLAQSHNIFDGIYCSHFVEHLPFEAVQRALELMSRSLSKGGILVLVFPDPESIRSQLLGFWRDPEHVRFYHAELITLMAATVGLELEWSSYMEQPHHVVPFPDTPPELVHDAFPEMIPVIESTNACGLGERLLQLFGLVTERRFRGLEEQLERWGKQFSAHSKRCAEIDQQLEMRTKVLWDVNQTWCWNDNVTLKLRKKID